MVSNYSTSYNVVNISLVLPILAQLYPQTTDEDTAICASSLLGGMILGQLIGGALGDSPLLGGRLGALRLVMVLQIIASIASSFVDVLHPSSTESTDVYVKLAIWRFILGVGAGGVYPLAAVLSAEQGDLIRDVGSETEESGLTGGTSTTHTNIRETDKLSSSSSARRVVLTFSTQGAGFVTVPIIAVILLHTIPNNLNLIWRIILGLGCVPGLVLVLLQWILYSSSPQHLQLIPSEEPVHTSITNDDDSNEADSITTVAAVEGSDIVLQEGEQESFQDEVQREQDTTSDSNSQQHMGWWESTRKEPGLCRKFVGTAGTWFLFDVIYYGNTIFEPIVVEAAFGGGGAKAEAPSSPSSASSIDLLQKTATDTLILTSIALPGYVVAGLVIGKRLCYIQQTPRYVMLQGFFVMGILYFVIGIQWSYLKQKPAILLVLYGCTFFFANYGPNTTTFILPSLMYSPQCRSTWNGISAASGKIGALVGATLFEPAADEWGDDSVMLVCSGLAIVAFIITYCFVPTDTDNGDDVVVALQQDQPQLVTTLADDNNEE